MRYSCPCLQTEEARYDQTLEIKKTKKPQTKQQHRVFVSFKLLVVLVNKIKKFPCQRKLHNSVNLRKFVKDRITAHLLINAEALGQSSS